MLALPFRLRSPRLEEANVRVVYLFHRSGDPLATVASEDVAPLEASQLPPVLGAVREFVDAPEDASRAYAHTIRRFGEESLVAVRGQYVSACAVYHGGADGTLRRELVRFVQDFEARNEGRLDTWEDAAGMAEEASSAITDVLTGPIASSL